jgi:hypothetical protein
VSLDPNNPYLAYNLARLENRFLNRYSESLEKERIRKEQGKPAHKTNIKSIEENKERLDKVRELRAVYTENTEMVFQSQAK